MFPNNIAGGNGLTRGSLHRHGFTQNNYTSEAKSGEAKKKASFIWILVHFSTGLL